MTEANFWGLIAQLDWAHTGEDDAVLAPVIQSLSTGPVADIEAFETILAEKLFALDTERHARHIGEYAYTDPDEPFDVDWFLYARCCVVANGRKFYEAVLANPENMPKNIEFEALLRVARRAHELKTGAEFDFVPPLSYETFSNKAGWAAA